MKENLKLLVVVVLGTILANYITAKFLTKTA